MALDVSTLEYDGGPFAGWAAQPGERTVSGELSAALATVLREPVALTVAGRTDRGVHALGQVVSYDGPLPSLRSVNAVLPREIAVLARRGGAARVLRPPRRALPRLPSTACSPATRRRRSSAGARCGGRSALDEARAAGLRRALLRGTHDFTAFTPRDGYHQRFERDVLDARWERAGDVLEFHIEADTFMRHMNRVLVGTMLEVATGRGAPWRASARCWRAARAPRRAARRRRTGSTWRRSRTS